jgi:hypothetical protein
MRQASLATPIPDRVRHALDRKRPPLPGHKEGKAADLRLVDDRLQDRQDRNALILKYLVGRPKMKAPLWKTQLFLTFSSELVFSATRLDRPIEHHTEIAQPLVRRVRKRRLAIP